MTTAGSSVKVKAATSESLMHRFLHQPRKLFLRRAMFQVHLWAGLLLALYVVVIALSGAVLVFKSELNARLVPRVLTREGSGPLAGIAAVVQVGHDACPRCVFTTLTVPSLGMPVYQLQGTDAQGKGITLLLDPSAKR